jgi:hypothetical protein
MNGIQRLRKWYWTRKTGMVNPIERILAHVKFLGLITQPMLQISQVSRFGGTLLSQLFDHHHEIWTYPHELKIGNLRKWNWPSLTTANLRQNFEILTESPFAERFAITGQYSKGSDTLLPINFDARLQRDLFCDLSCIQGPYEQLIEIETAFFRCMTELQKI